MTVSGGADALDAGNSADLRESKSREEIMLARNAMTLSPAIATPETSIPAVAALMRDWDTGIIPIVDGRESMVLVGVITDRDITTKCIAENHMATCDAAMHMSHERLVTVLPETPLDGCVSLMKESQVRRLPVVEPDGRLVGMLSLADVVRKLQYTDPHRVVELIGEISQPVAIHA